MLNSGVLNIMLSIFKQLPAPLYFFACVLLYFFELESESNYLYMKIV